MSAPLSYLGSFWTRGPVVEPLPVPLIRFAPCVVRGREPRGQDAGLLVSRRGSSLR